MFTGIEQQQQQQQQQQWPVAPEGTIARHSSQQQILREARLAPTRNHTFAGSFSQGIEGHGFYGNCVVPIIENTARECELTDRLRQAIQDYPQANAVLVRRHGEQGAQQAAG
jgi:hypothetical protein